MVSVRISLASPAIPALTRIALGVLSGDDLDASTITLILSVAYPIDDRTNVLAGLKLGDRDSDSTDDSDTTSYFVNFDFRLNPDLLLYSTLGLEEGAATVRSYCSGGYIVSAYSRRRWASASSASTSRVTRS